MRFIPSRSTSLKLKMPTSPMWIRMRRNRCMSHTSTSSSGTFVMSGLRMTRYPSDLSLNATIFDSGQIQMKGGAHFLAEPHASINADFSLQHIALEPLLPVTVRYNVQIRGGMLSTEGHLEYSAEGATEATVKTLTIEHARVDYVHLHETTFKETKTGYAAVKTAKNVPNKPETHIRIDHGGNQKGQRRSDL